MPRKPLEIILGEGRICIGRTFDSQGNIAISFGLLPEPHMIGRLKPGTEAKPLLVLGFKNLQGLEILRQAILAARRKLKAQVHLFTLDLKTKIWAEVRARSPKDDRDPPATTKP